MSNLTQEQRTAVSEMQQQEHERRRNVIREKAKTDSKRRADINTFRFRQSHDVFSPQSSKRKVC